MYIMGDNSKSAYLLSGIMLHFWPLGAEIVSWDSKSCPCQNIVRKLRGATFTSGSTQVCLFLMSNTKQARSFSRVILSRREVSHE